MFPRTALVLWVLHHLASLCVVRGFSHPQACCLWLGEEGGRGMGGYGSPTHNTGCMLTSEFQLCCCSASGHFHVGPRSFCVSGLPLEQGLLGPTLGRI